MAQYKDGDSRTINGVTYLRRGGMWLPQSGNMFSQKLPGELQGQSLQNQRTQQEIKQAEATATANTTKTKNEAVKSGIDVKAAQADLDNKLGTPPGDVTKTGPAYLATLPPGIGDLAREMLSGNYKSSITNSRNPVVMQAALAAAHATGGNFDAGRYDERLALMKGITNPNSQLGALNTAIAHAGMLYDQAPKVAGTSFFGDNVLSTGANAISNWFHSGSPGVTQYQSILQKYGPESARAYGVNTGGEREAAQAPLSINLPLDAKQASLKTDMDLFAGKIASLAHQNDILGGNHPIDYLSPEAKDALQKIDPEGYDKFVAATTGNRQNAIVPPASGNNTPPSAGFAPPPTGPEDGGPTSGGFNDKPDPESATFWERAAASGQPYRQALSDWRSLVASRGLTAQEPPPPGAYGKVSRYMQAHPNIEYHPFQSVERTPMTIGDQIANAAAQNGPVAFGVHAANNFAGNIPGLIIGPNKTAYYNQVSGQQHPIYSGAGDIAGTVGGAIGTGKALDGVAPALGVVGKFLTKTPARIPFTGDVLFGGVSGAAQNPDNPFLGAGLGAGSMALGNVVGRYALGPLIRAGGSAAGKLGMFAPPRALTAPESMVLNRADPIGDIRTNLQDAQGLNLPYSLADADPRLRALAGSAARKSPDVRAMAENTFGPRQQGQGERAIAQINSNLAPVGDVPSIMADARTRAQAASKPLYEAALKHPAPQDAKLNEMLDTPAGQAAAKNAYGIALNAGENPAELSFSTGPDGQPVINAHPNWKTLQYVKMGLDKVVTDNQNPITGKLDLSDPANRALNDLRGRFVDRLGELNPDYKAANQAYQGIIGQGAAAQRGAAATSAKVTPEQAQIAVTNAGSNLPFFRRGYASDMADQVERSRLSGNPYNTIYGSMGQRAKVGTIFPQGASAFDRANALEGDMAKTGTELFGGSQTQPRAEADKLFDSGLGDTATDLAFGLATGVPPPSLIKRGLGTFARDNLRLGIRGGKAKADQIGPMLLNPDPTAGLQTLDDLQRYALLRRGYVNQTNAYGGMFGAPLIYSAPSAFGLTQN